MRTEMTRRDLFRTAGLGAPALSLGSSALGAANVSVSTPKTIPLGYELPRLPYAYDALEPAIEARVLKVHHLKHHAGYVKGLKKTLASLETARNALDFSHVKVLSRNLAFTASGHALHTLYRYSMTPGGSPEPKGSWGRPSSATSGHSPASRPSSSPRRRRSKAPAGACWPGTPWAKGSSCSSARNTRT